MAIETVFSKGKLWDSHAEMLVVGVVAPSDSKQSYGNLTTEDQGSVLDARLGGYLTRLMKQERFRGDLGTSRCIPMQEGPRYILLVGAGTPETITLQTLRIMGAKIGQAAECARVSHVAAVHVNQVFFGLASPARLRAMWEGLRLGTYQFTRYKTKAEAKSLKRFTIIASGSTGALEKSVRAAEIVSESTCWVRDMVNTPTVDLSTPELVAESKKLAKSHHLDIRVIAGKDLDKEGMRLIAAVGQGSPNPPALIHLKYRPKGKARRKIALVGKGITYDTGGLNLKPGISMATMKDDMGGAAVVLAAMKALAEMKAPVAVDGIIATAENAIDGKSIRPGDVVRARNGKTVEIFDIDAEGRLVLADALDYACDQKPDVIIDIATLTGGIVVSLGEQCGGVFANNEAQVDRFLSSAEAAGELFWRMPLLKVYEYDLRSKIADLVNKGKSRALAITAALFLQQFVKDTAWIHLDIAGSVWANENLTLCPAGGTGMATRSIIEYCLGSSPRGRDSGD